MPSLAGLEWIVTGRWPASVWPSLILCYARVQLLVSLDFNVSTLFHCLVLNRTVSNEQQKWLQGCTSDKVHENGHNLGNMRPRTKIKPVLETRDPGLSAGYQKIQKDQVFVLKFDREEIILQNANHLPSYLDRDNFC